MKKAFYLVLILLLASCGSDKTPNLSTNGSPESIASSAKVTVESVLSGVERGKFREGELLVKFRSGVVASSARVHQTIGATSLRRFSIVPNLEHVKLPEGLSVKDAVKQYMSDPNVEFAEPNYIKRATVVPVTPNDTFFSRQWGMTKISAPSAWGITTGSADVIVGVLDTGIDFTHPDFVRPDKTSNISNNGSDFTTCLRSDDTCKCLVTKSPSSDPTDNNGHGTHVSGIIGAVGNNNIGVAGLNWNVQIMPLKMLDSTGCGDTVVEVAAIEYAVQLKNSGTNIKVLNASFAGPGSNTEMNAVSSANSAGILLVAAAGNDGTSNDLNPTYPASYPLPNVISVAATLQADTRASYSNFGVNSVHVAAPGGGVLAGEGADVLSTAPLNLSSFCDGTGPATGYEFCQGTSQAAPHVAALAGLLDSVYPNFTYSQIRGMIIKYVDVLPSLQNKIFSGGRINAFKAVSALLAPDTLVATASSPTRISLTWNDKATGEDGYKIERKTGADSFVQLASTGVNASSFTDDTVVEGTTYTYRVKAFTSSLPNPAGSQLGEADSLYSNEASATTPLAPIDGVCGSSNGQTFSSAPTTNLCSAGTASAVSGSGPWTWTCAGLNGGATASCSANVSTPAPSPSGGGGCSIGGRQNAPTSITDLLIILLPVLILAALRVGWMLRRY